MVGVQSQKGRVFFESCFEVMEILPSATV
jgi:hypothetical protein